MTSLPLSTHLTTLPNTPPPVVLDSGKNIHLPSRDPSRQIPCRVFHPETGKPKGLFYHIHGGGWVLQSEAFQDVMLQYLATHTNLIILSIGYRLAPEHPYPAGNEDCVDVGEHLIDNSERDYGVPLLFMTGDSAGGHLSVVTTYHLLRSRPNFALKGLVLNFGAYDLPGFLPQAWSFKLPLVLDVEIMQKFIRTQSDPRRCSPPADGAMADTSKLTSPTPRRNNAVIR